MSTLTNGSAFQAQVARNRSSGGSVLCLFERSRRWHGTLRAASCLASALEAPLVLDAAGSLRGFPRTRVAHVREVVRRSDAGTVVTGAARSRLGAVFAVERSPALAASTGIRTLLVPDLAANALAEGKLEGNALVCGVDGSPAAGAAAAAAGMLSEQLALRLHLVHVYDVIPQYPIAATGPGWIPPVSAQELERAAREEAREVLERAERLTGKATLTRLRRGPPGASLEAYAEFFGARLIVVGAPAHRPLSSALLGSTAWDLAGGAARPVMVVPEADSPGGPWHRRPLDRRQ